VLKLHICRDLPCVVWFMLVFQCLLEMGSGFCYHLLLISHLDSDIAEGQKYPQQQQPGEAKIVFMLWCLHHENAAASASPTSEEEILSNPCEHELKTRFPLSLGPDSISKKSG